MGDAVGTSFHRVILALPSNKHLFPFERGAYHYDKGGGGHRRRRSPLFGFAVRYWSPVLSFRCAVVVGAEGVGPRGGISPGVFPSFDRAFSNSQCKVQARALYTRGTTSWPFSWPTVYSVLWPTLARVSDVFCVRNFQSPLFFS